VPPASEPERRRGPRSEHRLENKANAKILRELKKGYEKSGGTSIPFDHKQLEEFFALVAKALAWESFGIRLENGYSAITSLFTNEGEAFFEQMLSRGSTHVTGDLGKGRSAIDHVAVPSLWRHRFRR
jgi:hypothetical protein